VTIHPAFTLNTVMQPLSRLPYGEPTFPSVVVSDPFEPGALLFGSDAVRSVEDGEYPVMFSKRKIGTLETMFLASDSVTAKDVAKTFLNYLRTCAEEALGSPVKRAIVTHPAYFDRAAVEETRQAAQEAGFEMTDAQQMLMEPVAAALAYTHSDKRDPLRVITYDLGGGTFDVTCLERSSAVIQMLSFDGDHLLGGYNFDRVIVKWIIEKLTQRGKQISLDENNPQDRSSIARLLQLAERVKLRLSESPSEDVHVPVRGRNVLVDQSGKDVPH
jgi:molecular chaperone DnaK